MTEPLRVCYVVNAVGESSVPADIAAALVDYTDVEVDILAWFDAESFEADDRVGVTCLDAPDTTVGADARTVRRAASILDEYDLVQAHHNHSGSFAKAIARYLGVPSVSREGNMRKGFNRMGRVANGLTNPLADRVVCNSRAVYDSFMRWETAILPDETVAFIPNGVDFERIDSGVNTGWSARETAGVDEETVLVGTAGMLTEQKDHETLIRGLATARTRSDVALALAIAGDGPKRDSLRALASDLGVDDAVHFLGYLDRQEVYGMLSEIDIYAMPSLWEGFSAAAVEGLALGNPAVFSDIPPFTGPYGDIARFHPTGDPAELADHLVDLASNPAERARLAAAGRELVESKYDIETVAEQYRDLYRSILGG
ncbi:glycosyltransferase family 4 protein [Haloarcula onubensis]|uniref:Glycosyltransferase family 4 protein n=1 Tax=Haloarcula onubensis TaxID=2950539 RepID=A0ABU2FN69_9EURY|nr:glycosyltransferase family 4 protein [Halomicroarcula sp. S3CR25-11]MDS0281741.1 glycosyltransferase family 4 protein [Halomicroarcula sp. S3CR25-11]